MADSSFYLAGVQNHSHVARNITTSAALAAIFEQFPPNPPELMDFQPGKPAPAGAKNNLPNLALASRMRPFLKSRILKE
jgi:hypothetical protein